MTRRSLLLAPALAYAAAPEIRREVFLKAPRKGVALMAMAYYTKKRGLEMTSIEERWSRSDTIDTAYYRQSKDNGKTWSEPVEHKTGERMAKGMLRRHLRGGWVDPHNGRLIEFWNEGVLPSDDPLEGLRQWQIYYRVGDDPKVHQIVHKGYEPDHPFATIWRGKNSVMIGYHPGQPLALKDGTILLPVSVTPLTEDGKLYNPTGGYTWHDSGVIRGRWRGKDIEWEMGQLVKGDPARVTRGMDEPTLGMLTRNRVLMVLRASNDKNHALPSYRWISISADGGRTWTEPKPWTYTTGGNFFSPSSCSQLVHHSSGRLYWLGNITPANPRGNRPRYPFVIGEVDQDSGLLVKNSVRIVDDKAPNEDPLLTLSNFYAREDRVSKEIAVHMTRMFAFPNGWEGDAMLYTIPVVR